MRATPALIRLHIDQGYLATARRMLDDLAARGKAVALLESHWQRAAERARREAAVRVLGDLLLRVRRARRRNVRPRGAGRGGEAEGWAR